MSYKLEITASKSRLSMVMFPDSEEDAIKHMSEINKHRAYEARLSVDGKHVASWLEGRFLYHG